MHSCTPYENCMAMIRFYILLIDCGRQVHYLKIIENIQLCTMIKVLSREGPGYDNCLTLQYCAALAIDSLISGVAGCQAGGPLADRRPIDIGDAFTTPTPFPYKARETFCLHAGTHP